MFMIKEIKNIFQFLKILKKFIKNKKYLRKIKNFKKK